MKYSWMRTMVVAAGFILFASSAMAGSNIPESSGKIRPFSAAVGDLTVTGIQTIAPTNDCSSVSVTITGKIQGLVDDGGGMDQVTFELWDDGMLKDSETVSVLVGNTRSIVVTMSFTGVYGTSAPGVGVIASEVGLYADPFYPTDVAGYCPAKCWITPSVAKAGDFITFNVELPTSAAPSLVKAYNGDLPLVTLKDPDQDGIWTGNWQVPAGINTKGWKSNFSILITEGGVNRWCPGFKLE